MLPAAVALAGAILLTLAIVGLSSLATSVLHLVARDRRRGELLALVFIIVLPLVGMVPGLLAGGSERKYGRPRAATAAGVDADLRGARPRRAPGTDVQRRHTGVGSGSCASGRALTRGPRCGNGAVSMAWDCSRFSRSSTRRGQQEPDGTRR